MTTRYIPLSAEIGTVMTTSVTTMQIIIEKKNSVNESMVSLMP